MCCYTEKMRKRQGVELVLKPINMHGGGYSNFLRQIKKESQTNYLAKFIIADNPDFEYVACLHDAYYKGQDTKNYIVKTWGYKTLDAFKSDTEVYEFLNSGAKSFDNLLGFIRCQDKLVKNKYEIKKKTFDISIKSTVFTQELIDQRASNIDEFFDVIDW